MSPKLKPNNFTNKMKNVSSHEYICQINSEYNLNIVKGNNLDIFEILMIIYFGRACGN